VISLWYHVKPSASGGQRHRRFTFTSDDSPQVLIEGAAILAVVIVDVDVIVDPRR
jgi:hypothetical protein